MGIAGAGNSGTVFSTLFANRIATHYDSWHVVFGLALIPIVIVFIVFSILAKDSPNQPAPRKLSDYAKVLSIRDTWLFCLLYGVTFGGFVGMANYLTIFFNTQYDLSPVRAADFATLCVIAGSFFRPVGGWLSDKVGGINMLIGLYSIAAIMLLGISTLPSMGLIIVLLFVMMMSLGMGNGAVFQLVPQRFQKEIGLITGIVGAAGGLGGYFLPKLLGNIKQSTGSYTTGFLIASAIAALCVVTLLVVQGSWKRSWLGTGGKARVENNAALNS
jgi:NNP family nitrate/nitrite transporter-like MFS transporter